MITGSLDPDTITDLSIDQPPAGDGDQVSTLVQDYLDTLQASSDLPASSIDDATQVVTDSLDTLVADYVATYDVPAADSPEVVADILHSYANDINTSDPAPLDPLPTEGPTEPVIDYIADSYVHTDVPV